MAEENDDFVRNTTGPDSLAARLAFDDVESGEAREYLRKQNRLTDLQIENLQKLDEYETSHLKWRRFNDQMKGAMQIMIVLIGAMILIGLGTAIWNASQADGIVVDAFSVPSSFSANGIGGDVVADDLTNKIAAIRIEANRNSFAASKDVEHDRGEDIKIDIPETGISLGEAWRYLRNWLGHERALHGSVRALATGRIALTVVLEGDAPATFTGAAADLGTLEQEAAEHVFANVDPGNYVLYLDATGRPKDAYAAASQFAQSEPGALSLLAAMTRDTDVRLSLRRARLSLALAPAMVIAHREIMVGDTLLGHEEEVLSEAQKLQAVRPQDLPPAFRGRGYTALIGYVHLKQETGTGDFLRAQTELCFYCSSPDSLLQRAMYAARSYDPALSRSVIASALALGPVSPAALHLARYYECAASENWHDAAAEAQAFENAIAPDKGQPFGSAALRALTVATPLHAEALARSGHVAAAQSAITSTPRDCYHCVRTRGIIAALQSNQRVAAGWFMAATRLGHSLPFAYTDWGAMLLLKGDYDAAIQRFREANLKGPHFADPLEMWGEALMQENRSDLALAKFEEASKYAPNWGRLHLKWGEALDYAGKKDEARKQFAIVSGLYLSTADRATLARISRKQARL